MDTKYFIGGIMVVALVGVGLYMASIRDGTRDEITQHVSPTNTATNSEAGAITGGAVVEKAELPDSENQAAQAQYVSEVSIKNNYELEQYISRSGSTRFVLFFYAPWCPFCKVADQAFSSRQNEIPAGTAVIRVDYDSNTELKKRYGVTYQHTFVQVDPQGNQISKWNGGDLDNLKKYLK